MLPKDPVILLSYINMKLRNTGRLLEEFCEEEQIDVLGLYRTLDTIDYHYDRDRNQFV